jgi:hypothetical protein
MMYVDKRTIEQFEIIQPWANPNRYKQLVDAAVKAKRSKKHRHLDTDYSEEERKLMDIFYIMILDDKSFSDEPTPSMGYFDTVDDFAVEAFFCEGYLRFRLSVDCGSYMTCEYVRKVPNGLPVYSYDHLRELIVLKHCIFKKHVDAIEKRIKEAQARKDDLQKTLAAVDTANTLMSIFGLSLDSDSKKKIDDWKTEYFTLEKECK